MPACRNEKEEWLGCHTPKVNLRECVTHTPSPSTNKAAHSGFETPEVQNRGISGSTKRTCVLQIFYLKKKLLFL